MPGENIISFTDSNKPYRYKVTTSMAENSDQCKVFVEELNESDQPVDSFEFVYDVAQDLPQADVELHEKPIRVLLNHMLSTESDPRKWSGKEE